MRVSISPIHRALVRVAAVAVTAVVMVAGLPGQGAQAEPSRRVSAWLPYWDPTALDDFVAHRDLYDQVLPFWYEMRSANEIAPYHGAGDQAVIDAARAGGVAILPTITNDFDPARVHEMLATDQGINEHVAALTALAAPYDGIDVDYESLFAADRARFTLFVQRLATSLHASGKLLSMTVHPKTSEPGNWDGPQAQNWAAIGAVSDRVRIMAYDYHWATSTAGPVAPATWVREVATFAVSQIPAAKVNLGMPLYGYDWVGSSGEGLVWKDVEARRLQRGASIQRSADGEPSFSYSAGGVAHTVWYSDAGSTAPKLQIASDLGLSGVTFWRLGGEDPAVWDATRSWLDPTSTVDTTPPTAIDDLWAKPGSRRVVLGWSAAVDASAVSYRVMRSTSATGTLTKIAVITATRFTDTTMRLHKTSWYAIRPVDAAGNVGPLSPRVAARPFS